MSHELPYDVPHSPKAKDIVLTVFSALFVVAGFVVAALGGVWPGLIAVVFFGGCLFVGIHQIAGPDSSLGKIAIVLGCFTMGLGCFAFAYATSRPFSETQVSGGWRGDTTVIFVGVFGGLFFCLGSIAIVVNSIVVSRRIKRQQQWYQR